MSETSASKMLNAASTMRALADIRYPSSPFQSVVPFDVTLASSINGRGPKWRTRRLPKSGWVGSIATPYLDDLPKALAQHDGAWLLPHLDLSLRAIAPLGLIAAVRHCAV